MAGGYKPQRLRRFAPQHQPTQGLDQLPGLSENLGRPESKHRRLPLPHPAINGAVLAAAQAQSPFPGRDRLIFYTTITLSLLCGKGITLMKPTPKRPVMIIMLCFALASILEVPAEATNHITSPPPQTTQAPNPEGGVDPHALAVGAGILGGAILYNIMTCGLAVSAVAGGLAGDYLYRKYAAPSQTPTTGGQTSP